MANKITLTYEESWHAMGRKMPADCTVAIDAPGTCTGEGDIENFSPIELFSVSYAGCVIMSMDLAARKTGFSVAGSTVKMSLTVMKETVPSIRRVKATIVLPKEYTEQQMEVLRQATHYCPIHSALRPELETILVFEVAQ